MRSTRWATLAVAACAAMAAAPPALAAGASVRRVHVPLAARHAVAAGAWRIARPVHVAGGFRLVGLHWQGDPAAVFEVRVRPGGGSYGAWRPLDHEDLPTAPEQRLGTHHATEGLWIGRAKSLQVRYRAGVASVTAIVVDPGPDPTGRLAAAVSGSPGQPAIVPRAGWGADETLRRGTSRYSSSVQVAFVHHTATPNGYSARNAAAVVRSIYLYHVRGNGWNDIGYNFLIDRFGRVYEGRAGGVAANVIGAHTGGFNVSSFGVAMIGDFSTASPSAAAVQQLERLLAWRMDVAHADPKAHPRLASLGNERFPAGRSVKFRAIAGHRDAGLTDCPGQRLYALLPAIRRAVARIGSIKIYAPTVRPPTIQPAGAGIRPITFAARLSHPGRWHVRVTTTDGRAVATFSGSGRTVAATWKGSMAGGGVLPPASVLRWSIDATRKGKSARPAAGGFTSGPPPATLTAVHAAPPVVTGAAAGAVSYTLTAAASVTVTVQTVAGAAVKTLQAATTQAIGVHQVTWDATGSGGGRVASGHYRYAVTAAPTGGSAVVAYAAVDVRRQVAGLSATAAISPNGDGLADTATIDYMRAETGDAAIQLMSGSRVAVRVASLYAQAPGAFHYSWAAAGVADGSYQLRLLAPGAGGALDLRVPIVIDTHAPSLHLTRVSRSRTRVVAALRLSEPATIQIRVGGQLIRTTTARRAGKLRLAVSRATLHGRRILTLIATDRLGNRGRTFHVRVR